MKKNKYKSAFMKTIILTIAAIIIFSFGSFMMVSASDNVTKPYGCNKYYTSITVEKNDTLWSIADKYEIHESDKKNFVNDVISMNNMNNNVIYAGQTLIVYYYSDEEK